MIEITLCTSREEWDLQVLAQKGHPLQLWGWGEVKAKGSWRVRRLMVLDNGKCIGIAQILVRPLPKPFTSLAYIPRGPVAEEGSRAAVLSSLATYAKDSLEAVSLMVEPDWASFPDLAGWKRSPNSILLARTLVLDMHQSEDELLGAMTKKTRQYIRKSEKDAVTVRRVNRDDIAQCLAIYKETARRAGFDLHDDDYYYAIYDSLGDQSWLFVAEYEGRAVAFLWLVASQETAFELYGGVSDEGQQLRANYTLKWTAVRHAKEQGVHLYDMNGLLNDGVSQFKQSFAGHETQLAGSYEKPLSLLYPLWAKGLPTAKKIVRTIKKR